MSSWESIRSGMTVVVTGGAGFIGATLVRKLLDLGCSVAVIDDLSGGKVANLPHHPRLSLHTVCIAPDTAAAVEAVIGTADLVYHLASPIGVALAHSARYSVVESILESGTTVIRACRKHRCPLVITSSSEVYGQGLPRPLRETDPVMLGTDARWGYAAAKASLEHLALGLHHDHGIPAWVVRPFNIAGPRQRPETGLVVACFVAAAAAGRPIEIHGDGTQMRSFLHVADTAEALAAIAFNAMLAGQPVNLGNETAITIGELAQVVRRELGCDVPVIHRPLGEIFDGGFTPAQTRTPDVGLLRRATGWRPTRTIEEAVRDCHRAMMAPAPMAAGAV